MLPRARHPARALLRAAKRKPCIPAARYLSSAPVASEATKAGDEYDVVVVGGGIVGAVLGAALGRVTHGLPRQSLTSMVPSSGQAAPRTGLRVALLEHKAPRPLDEVALLPAPDLRVYAMNPASAQSLKGACLLCTEARIG